MIDHNDDKPLKSPRSPDTPDGIVGTRIRQQRRELGITQRALAERLGISASYLNLIEWNKRRVGGRLLHRTAEALDLSVDELGGASERRLAARLGEIGRLPPLQGLGIEEERTDELVGRFPGWSRGIAALARSERTAVDQARILSERLANDPFLSIAVHRMLTRIAAIRSAVEILTDYEDIPADRRDRFTQIIKEESGALSDAGEALALYLERSEQSDTVMTAVDEVEALYAAHGNRFDAIEAAAAALIPLLRDTRPVSRRAQAQELAEEHLGRVIADIIDTREPVRSGAARVRARRSLLRYAVGAILMPMPAFADAAAQLRYDVEALSQTFSSEAELVCLRLTALPRQETVPQFGYLRANAAGTIIEMLGLAGLAVPRWAPACPLWVLYRAQQSPEAVIRQRALFPTGARFVFVARARHTGTTGFGKPRHYITEMITMSEEDARRTVYAPDNAAPVEEVGPGCRLCPRAACPHRVEDPLAA